MLRPRVCVCVLFFFFSLRRICALSSSLSFLNNHFCQHLKFGDFPSTYSQESFNVCSIRYSCTGQACYGKLWSVGAWQMLHRPSNAANRPRDYIFSPAWCRNIDSSWIWCGSLLFSPSIRQLGDIRLCYPTKTNGYDHVLCMVYVYLECTGQCTTFVYTWMMLQYALEKILMAKVHQAALHAVLLAGPLSAFEPCHVFHHFPWSLCPL